jgi:hypothetical protein
LPNRVGDPKITPSAQTTSSGVATGTSRVASACACQAGFEAIAAAGASSATLCNRTSAPASRAPAVIDCASSWTVPVAE